MRISKLFCILGLLSGLVTHSHAVTTVNVGSINQINGPGSLDLTNVIYAVDFQQNLPNQTVNGVTFVHDATPPPGFSSVGPRDVVEWQTKPEFGATADDTALEEIYSDIRWTLAGTDPPLQANMDVTPGLQYRLQVLFYANHGAENRVWDIQVDGVDAVENITSLGIDTGTGPPAYSPNIGLAYVYDFTAPDAQVNVVMGQLFGTNFIPGTDSNAIWQGIILTQIPEPSTFALGAFAVIGLLRRRRSAA